MAHALAVTSAHDGTPMVAHLDAQGRTVRSVAHDVIEGVDTFYETRTVLDAQGRVLQVLDARGNEAEGRTPIPDSPTQGSLGGAGAGTRLEGDSPTQGSLGGAGAGTRLEVAGGRHHGPWCRPTSEPRALCAAMGPHNHEVSSGWRVGGGLAFPVRRDATTDRSMSARGIPPQTRLLSKRAVEGSSVTRPRRILTGEVVMGTRRCSERRFFLRPGAATNVIFKYCLARAVRITGVLLHDYQVLSNHYHLVFTDVRGNRGKFFEELNALVARAVNREFGHWESFFAPGSYNAPVLLDGDAIEEKCIYVHLRALQRGGSRAGQFAGILGRRM